MPRYIYNTFTIAIYNLAIYSFSFVLILLQLFLISFVPLILRHEVKYMYNNLYVLIKSNIRIIIYICMYIHTYVTYHFVDNLFS